MVRRAAREITPEESRKRKLKIAAFGCGGAIALVLVILLVAYILVRSSPPLPRELQEAQKAAQSAQGGAAQTPQAPGMQPQAGGYGAPGYQGQGGGVPAPSMPAEQQFEQLKQASREGRTGNFQINVSEADMNSQLMRDAGKGGYSSATVAFLDGEILSTGSAQWGGKTWEAMVRAKPVMEGGRPRIVISEAYIGRLPAPAEAVSRMQAEMDRGIEKALGDARNAKITGISVRRGQVLIDGILTGPGQ
jgi:hypothetical protein